MYEVIAIGVSAGGLGALSKIIPVLPIDFPLAVIIVQHRAHDPDDFLVEYLSNKSDIDVREAVPGAAIESACVHVAPSGYHLLVERDKTFSLSLDPPVKFAIPSIDVFFETAAITYQHALVGVVLTGANDDGSQGLKKIKDSGGLAIVQDPETAEVATMPNAAIACVDVDHIIPLDNMGVFLSEIDARNPS